jgi:2-keto-4-pentenoate hydratase
MAAQLERFHAVLAAGAPRLGWKIAFNDPAAQQRAGLPGPQIAWIDGRHVAADGGAWVLAPGSRVHVEAEVAIRMAHDVPADAGIDAARAAIAGVAPAIELVDYAKPSSPLAALIENAFFHAGTVFGAEVAGIVADADTALLGVDTNGSRVAAALPGRVPADLGEIVVLAADTLARFGERLLAGDRIICGSYITPFPAAPGDRVVARYGGTLGTAGITFKAAERTQ